jgi:hypothetical protein
MFPASTKGGGQCFAFPDVCKVPAPPAPPVPTPFPNIAQCADATKCSEKVKILNKAVIHKGSEISRSSGDEAGTLKGIVSGTTQDKAVFRTTSAIVQVEGNDLVMHLCVAAQNGSNANAPPGTQVAPSQSVVIVGG